MEEKKYKIGNKEFATEEEYLAAVSDLKKIMAIKKKYDTSDPEQAKAVLSAIRKNPQFFQTAYGKKFIRELEKVILIGEDNIQIEEKPKERRSSEKKNRGKKKRIIFISIAAVVSLVALICIFWGGDTENQTFEKESGGDVTQGDVESKAERENVYVEESDIDKVYSNADSYKGKFIKIIGRVFSVEKDGDFVYLQVFRDMENSEQNTIIRYEDSGFDISEDDYVEIDGEIIGEESGENVLGGIVTALMIDAKSAKKISYKDARHPTIKEIKVDQTAENDGYSLTLEKVEFSEKQTRLYFTFSNNGSEEFCLNTYSIRITQGTSQYETEMDYDSDYEELQEYILPGITSSGIVTFRALNQEEDFMIYAGGYSDESYEDYNFQFEITGKDMGAN